MFDLIGRVYTVFAIAFTTVCLIAALIDALFGKERR